MDEKQVREAIKALEITIDIGKQKIEYNKTFEPKNDNEYIEKSIECAKTAIKALEKQLAKKVEIEAWCPSYCPSCGYELSEDLGDGYYKHPNFIKRCPNPDCAQLLDWSE